MARIDAVIFDRDGTLVDGEPLANAGWIPELHARHRARHERRHAHAMVPHTRRIATTVTAPRRLTNLARPPA